MDFLRTLYKKNIAAEKAKQQRPTDGNRLEVARALSGYSRFIISLGILLIGVLWLFVGQHINDDYDRTFGT